MSTDALQLFTEAMHIGGVQDLESSSDWKSSGEDEDTGIYDLAWWHSEDFVDHLVGESMHYWPEILH